MKKSILLLFTVLLLSACAQVNYVGRTLDPTTEIDVFYDEKDVDREYTVIGQAVGSASWFVKNQKIQDKLIKTAKHKGANGIIITGLGTEHIYTGDGNNMEETKISAVFFVYDE